MMGSLSARGFLYSPSETLEAFQKRCRLLDEMKGNPTLFQNIFFSQNVVKYPMLKYEDLDVEIDWLFAILSKKGLPVWEAAATWILEVEGSAVPLLQLKNSSEEMLKHEAVHIVRASFKEPIYEEFLAYATSKHKWRKWLGPLFRSSRESLLFVLFSFFPLFSVFFPIAIHLFFLAPGIFLAFLLGRLCVHQWIFKKALVSIRKTFDVDNSLKIALRLSDKEIRLFALSNLKELVHYIDKQRCPRWNQILTSYKLSKY